MNTSLSCTLLLALLLLSTPAAAQLTTRIGNEFIAANVVTDPQWGRFWLTAGSHYNDTVQYTFASGPSFISSNIIFRVDGYFSSTPRYTSNIPTSFGFRPRDPVTNSPIAFHRFEQHSVSGDTLTIVWDNVFGFDITMRMLPEPRQHQSSSGGDMLIEFEYSRRSGTDSALRLGIAMMFDLINSDAQAIGGVDGGEGDRASVITSDAYYPSGGGGALMPGGGREIPEFYLTGNFRPTTPLNTIFPIHRLRGYSHGGTPLTEPTLFALADWTYLRDVVWNPSNARVHKFSDAACFLQWEQLRDAGLVRTAFGTSDQGGNNMHTCRDSSLFVNLRAPRVILADSTRPAGTDTTFVIEAWITNTSDVPLLQCELELAASVVAGPGNVTLRFDNSTPAKTTTLVAKGATTYQRWLLHAESPAEPCDVLLALDRRIVGETGWRPLCGDVLVSFNRDSTVTPPHELVDSLAPVVVTTKTGESDSHWQYRIADGGRGFDLDTGIDTVRILVAENFDVTVSSFDRCDTAEHVTLDATVIEFEQPARLVFEALDCRGNIARDSLHNFISGVDEHFNAQRLSMVRPQPARAGERVMIDVVGLDNLIHPLRISSIDGREVARLEVTAPVGGDGTIMFELPEGLMAGTYVVAVGDAAVIVVVE